MSKRLLSVLALCFAALMVVRASAGDSQIVADPTAPNNQRPQIIGTAGGLPQVNINTPNGGGLSYNRYQQFDVGKSGAILNNSNKNVQTQLGGWIENNPNLPGKTASLIVNEVNSPRASQLGGFVEVAGARADVVIANPSGINVAGGGFINANRATLTTGKPIIENGALTGYDVRGGSVNVSGDGLNFNDASYADIIARSATINAGVWASNIQVITGENRVSRDGSLVESLDAETGVSLDVGALGGMYANQIRLVGTGRGVGVNTGIHNKGEIVARVGDVVISADGSLVSSGTISGQSGVFAEIGGEVVNDAAARIQSSGGVNISSERSIDNRGEIVAGKDSTLTADGDVINTGVIQSRGVTDITAKHGKFNNTNEILSADRTSVTSAKDIVNSGEIHSGGDSSFISESGSIDNQNVIAGAGNMNYQAWLNLTNSGDMQSQRELSMQAQTGNIGNSGQLATASSANIISAVSVSNSGEIQTVGSVHMQAESGTIDNQGNMLSGGDLDLSAREDLINAGSIESGGKLSLLAETGTLDNSGELATAGEFSLETQGDFVNAGLIESGGSLNIHSKAGGIGNTGEFLANASMNLAGQLDVTNSGSIQAVGDLDVKSLEGSIANDGEILANGNAFFASEGNFTNTGLVQNLGDLTVASASGLVNNSGEIVATGGGSISSLGDFHNTGLLQTANDLSIVSRDGGFFSDNEILSDAMVMVSVDKDIINTGLLQGRGAIEARTANGLITNSGSILSNSSVTLFGNGNFTNSGRIQGLGDISVFSEIGSFTNTAEIISDAGLTVSARADAENSGLIQGQGNISIASAEGAFTNRGDILSGGAIAISSHNDFKNEKLIQGKGDVDFSSATGVFENRGDVFSEAALSITSELSFLNAGFMQGLGDFTVASSLGTLTSTGDIISGGKLTMSGQGTFTNEALIQAFGGVGITSREGAIVNRNEILSNGSVAISGKLDFNSIRLIQALGDMALTSLEGAFTTSADILANGTLSIFSKNNFTNSALIQSLGDLSIVSSTGNIANNRIVTNGAGVITGAGNFRTTGLIQALGDMALTGSTFDNSGEVLSNANVIVKSPLGFANSGKIEAVGNLSATTNGAIANTGRINTGGDSELLSGRSVTNSGTVQSRGNMTVRAGGGDITNTGSFVAGGNADISISGAMTNRGGSVSVGEKLVMAIAAGVSNTGLIVADKSLITAAGLFHNTGVVDGGEVVLKVSSLQNYYTGTILGDYLAVQAGSIMNGLPGTGTGTSGLLGARVRLDLGAGSITNREDGLLYSGGDIFVGGSLDGNNRATSSAGSLLNSSAVIDAAGSIRAAVGHFQNINAHYATEVREVKRWTYEGYRLPGKPLEEIWNPKEDSSTHWDGGEWAQIHGQGVEDFFLHKGEVVEYDTFVTSSRPGFVYTGGDLTVTGSLTNDKSKIFTGRTVSATGGFNNIAAIEPYTVTETGTFEFTTVEATGWRGKHKRVFHGQQAYNPPDVITYNEKEIVLNVSNRYRAASQRAGGQGTGPDGVTGAENDGIAFSAADGYGLQNASFELKDGKSASRNVRSGIGSGAGGAQSVDFYSILNLNFNANMFTLNPSPSSNYLVETNPRLTSYREWVGSDFMVARLNVDPSTVQKRLGDAFYEQRLVREQINNLTGQRFLGDYASDNEQYMALMTAGVEFAEEFGLIPGLTLSAELMAQLTSDIVWLEYVTVDTPNGPQRVLAPTVYLAPGRESVINADGTLVSAKNIEMNLSGDFANSGTVYGSESVNVSAKNISNSGNIAGKMVSLAALKDLENVGGSIKGVELVDLKAGGDITIASKMGGGTSSTTGFTGRNSYIDRVGTVSVTGENGVLNMTAGRDLSVIGAAVDSAGTAALVAGRDISIGTVEVGYDYQSTRDEKNNSRFMDMRDVGSAVSAVGGIEIKAGNDLNITGSTVYSDGHVALEAGNNVNITEGRQKTHVEDNIHYEDSGFLSEKSTTINIGSSSDTAIGSEISGNTVSIISGGDTAIRGSTVAASEGAGIEAGGNIDIAGAENYESSWSNREDTRSGFGASFSGGRVGVSYGTSEKGTTTKDDATYHTASLVGSESGDVALYADQDVNIKGSQIVAGTGDLAISGENITIENQFDTADNYHREYQKESSIGLSLGASGKAAEAVSKVGNAVDMAGKAGSAGSDRAGALWGIAAGREGYDAGKDVMGLATSGGNPVGDVGISARIGYSESSSESTSTSHEEIAVGSGIVSGGNTTIVARGDDGRDGTGNLSIIGSTVDAGGDVLLAANNDITLKSAEEKSSYENTNESSSFGIGASVGVGVGQGGAGIKFGLDGNMSQSEGNGSGVTVGHAETVISGGGTVEFASVNDTTIQGAQVIGDKVVGTVGGDLNIISEQDTESHRREQSSSGGSASVGWTLGAGGPSVGGSYSSQDQNGQADYKSVNEQSGIYAGTGGFDVTVGGNTHLEGAVIASAANSENNSLVTGTLTTSDIENESSYSAETSGWGGEASYEKNGSPTSETANKGHLSPSLPMNDSGYDSSRTQSAIADGHITITDEAGQLAATGQTAEETISSLNRDTDSAHGGALERPANLDDLLAKQAELVEATAAAGKAVAKTVGDISQAMYINNNEDKRWAEGGIYKTILQGAGAALVGQLGNGQGLDAALGAMASQLAAGEVGKFTNSLASYLGDDPDAKKLISNILANIISTGIGAAVGGSSGGNLASIMDRHNRQVHEVEKNLCLRLAHIDGEFDPDLYERLMDAADVLVLAFMEFEPGSEQYNDYLDRYIYAMQYYQDEIEILKGYKGQVIDGMDFPVFGFMGDNPDRLQYFTYSHNDLERDLSFAYGKPITLGDIGREGFNAVTNYDTIRDAYILAQTGSPTETVIGYTIIGVSVADAATNFIPGKMLLKGAAKKFFEIFATRLGKNAADNLLRNLGEKGFKELAESIGEQGIKQLEESFSRETLEVVLKQVPKDTFEKLAKEGLDNLGEGIGKEIADVAVKNAIKDKATAQTAKNISNLIVDGHAFTKHLKEFRQIGITTRKELKEHAQKIMLDPKSEMLNLPRGRTAWWDSATGTVVIHNPAIKDGSTIFRPQDGRVYFDDLINH